MSCSKCSVAFENKFVQCFDQQEIAMYMKRTGQVKLVHGEVTENTNFNYCPYCGEKLEVTINLRKPSNEGMAMVIPPIEMPLMIDPISDIQKTIIDNILKSGADLMKGGSV